MMNSSDDNDRLEQFIDDALRDLPLRHAPAELSRQVVALIARRANRPWWRRSYAHWPLPARVAFCVASAGLAMLAIPAMQLLPAASQLSSSIGSSALVIGLKTLFMLQSLLLGSVPSLWIYGGVAIVAAMYAAVFGIGAIAYRTLYANR